MRISYSGSSLPFSSLSLVLIYTLFVSLCAPFVVRKVEAASIVNKVIQPAASSKPLTPNSPQRANGLLIHFQANTPEDEINALVESKGSRRVRHLRGQSGIELLGLNGNQDAEALVADLRLNPIVQFAEPNYLITADKIALTDPRFAVESPFRSFNNKRPFPSFNPGMAARASQAAATSVIAVIDSGVDWTHPDLSNKRWANEVEQVNGMDDDQDGFIDDHNGWHFVAESDQQSDEQGHGTATAGIIAAQGNNLVGVSSSMSQFSLMSLRVLDGSGVGDVARAIEAIDYAVAHGAQIINCSWGTDGASMALRAAVERAAARSVTVVTSAGNVGRDIEGAEQAAGAKTVASRSTAAEITFPASPVIYGYDAAGNRTSMADGLGSVTYHYDSLSRMDWEERFLTGVGVFKLSYAYNLAGQLTSITDPFNSTINYTRDQAGRTTSIAGPAFGGVSQYVSNIKYRAWGALKSLSYGNGRAMSASYNPRMQVSHFEVPTVMSWDYEYNADGRVSVARDLQNGTFSRSYSYDHLGRLKYTATTASGPYEQFFSYDVWDNLTNRAGSNWGQDYNESVTYLNNRNTAPDWGYDADGRGVKMGSQTFSFDASGRTAQVYNPAQTGQSGEMTLAYGYDGDGQRLREIKTTTASETTYYIRSSVLGGRAITELNQSGQKQVGYVYPGTEQIARQSGTTMEWIHESPITGSQRRTATSGSLVQTGGLELDALGNNLGLSDPNYEEPIISDQAYPRFGDASNTFGGCTLDGAPMDCNFVMTFVNNGSAAQCPNNDCSL